MKKSVLYLSILFLALFSCTSEHGNPDFEEDCDTGWDYPIKPGMEVWYTLQTEEDRIAAVQVPECVLAILSPDDAVRLYITFPSYGLIIAWSSMQESFNMMLSRYNILQHIMSRKDVGGSLIAAYKDITMSGFKTLPYSKLMSVELLLAQKEILQNMTPDERLELMMEARSKYFENSSNENFSETIESPFQFRIMAGILYVDEYPELMASPYRENITEYVNSGRMYGESIDEIKAEIGKMTDSYINNPLAELKFQ